MRIGLLSTAYPAAESDAAGRFVRDMAEALAARDHDVVALFPSHAERDHRRGGRVDLRPLRYAWPRALERTFYGAGVPDNVRARPPLALLGLSFTARLALAARAEATGWDAVVAHFLLPSGLVAASLGLPCVVVAHSADLHLLERVPGRRLLARAIDRHARLWFVSGESRARFERVLGRSLGRAPIVSPMGARALAPTPRAESRRRLGVGPNATVVAALSRLVPVKGLDVAVSALEHLPGEVALLVGGEGPLGGELARLARRSGADLRLLGPLDDAGKRDLFGAADVFVMPSRTLRSGRTEGVPVALLEARAAGLPVVASRVGGIAEVSVADPGVTLVPEGDPFALARAISSAAASGRSPSPAVPSWEKLARRLESSLRGEPRPSCEAARTGRCGRRPSGRSGVF